MTLPIRQHYIPIWLQQNFIQRYDPSGQIWIHDLQTARSFRQAPRNVGYEKDLYTLDQPHEEKIDLYVIETHANARFDGDGSRVVAAIRRREMLPPPADDLWALLGVVSWQAIRTPASMEAIVEFTNKFYSVVLDEQRKRKDVVEETKADILSKGDDPDLHDFEFEDFVKVTDPSLIDLNIPKNLVLDQALKRVVHLNDRFLRRKWRLLVAKGDDRFIIGDNPVVPIARSGHGSFGSPDCFIYMPLTQRLALAGVADERFGFKDVHPLSRSKVALLNRVMVASAKRWVFSTEKTFYHDDGRGNVAKSGSFFAWRKGLEAEASAAGRKVHLSAMPDEFWEATAQEIFKKSRLRGK